MIAVNDDTVVLPGSDDGVPEKVEQLVDEITNEDKILRFTTDGALSKEITVHVFHSFDNEQGPVYVSHVPEAIPRTVLSTRASLYNSLADANEGEILNPEEVEGDVASWHETMGDRENPLHEVHVFVKTTDDGRYKDSWDFYRGDSEEAIRVENGLPGPESDEKFVYHYLGTVAEVLDDDFEAEDFDLKQSGGRRLPIDLMYMVDGSLSERVTNAIESESGGVMLVGESLMELMDRYEDEFWLGLFSWLLIPPLILWALVVAAGVGTMSFAKLLDLIFEDIRPGDTE